MIDDFTFEFGGYTFGLGHVVSVGNLDTGTLRVNSQAVDNPGGGSRTFGRTLTLPDQWSFEMHTRAPGPEGALAALEKIRDAWQPPQDGSAAPLRYRVDGRTRVVFGQPNRFSAPPSTLILSGLIRITADFLLADLLHYDDAVESKTVTAGASTPVGGFRAPFVFPLRSTVTDGPRVSELAVVTSAPTWVTVTFNGASTFRPRVSVGGWSCGLDAYLGFGESVVVDPRPWEMSATRQDGVPVNGLLSNDTRLSKMLLPAGVHPVSVAADSSDGPVSVTFSWRPASRSL